MYYRGTTIKIISEREHGVKLILATSFKKDFAFQLICIEGYNPGILYGYIKKDEKIQGYKAVGSDHLISELKSVLGEDLEFEISHPQIMGL